jgi:hypothetical protein
MGDFAPNGSMDVAHRSTRLSRAGGCGKALYQVGIYPHLAEDRGRVRPKRRRWR